MLNKTKLKFIIISSFFIFAGALIPAGLASADEADCAGGYYRVQGDTTCHQLKKSNPGGSQACDAFVDVSRVETKDNNDCIIREYCTDSSKNSDARRGAGCEDSLVDGSSTSGGNTTSTNFAGDCNSANLDENNCGIVKYIVLLINALSAIVGVVVVIMIVIGGIQYSVSRDNPQAVQAAKSKIINAIVALVGYMFMFGLLQYLVPGGIL
jgi:hypothetical protein